MGAKMRIRSLVTLAFMLGAAELSGQSFSFYSTLQAGRPGTNDWEVGVGNTAGAPSATASFGYETSGSQFWRDNGLPQSFRVGWDALNNRGYVTVYNSAGDPTTVTLQNAGPALSATVNWTLPTGSFLVSATPSGPQTSSIELQNLQFSSGVNIVSGSLPSTLTAAENGTATTTSLSAPILLNASATGGSWYVDGTVRFTGLITMGGNAKGNQLQFLMGASGTEAPETSSFALLGGGLIAFGVIRRRMHGGSTK